MSGDSNVGGGGDAPPPSAPSSKSSKLTVEKTYQKKTQLEHILLRPDTYIGTVERTMEEMWVYNAEDHSIVKRKISYVPGLLKIFDEILVNAADNKQRDPSMNAIKIEIKPEENVISVWNNGKGIPVVVHKEEKMLVPTMIFGHLLTSSNYSDEEEKVTGGRNGFGAKLCNIFSTSFTVETSSTEYKKSFRQKWADNMSKTSEPKVKDDVGQDYTKVTFSPDLSKFNMDKLDKDIVDLMSRRACDVAGSTGGGVKVYLNGKNLQIKNFRDYVGLYLKKREDEDEFNQMNLVYEKINDRWEVAMTPSDNEKFQQISFVNSIATTKGGKHVEYVVDMVVKKLIETTKKKNRGGMDLKPQQVKNHLWVFINCLIVNPAFNSQTKEYMTTPAKNFGSKVQLPEKFVQRISRCVVDSLVLFAKSKQDDQLAKTTGKQRKRLNIPKLDDANHAGEKNKSMDCTLILTEGDSAKSTAVCGLGVVGRDKYGVFPLRGKLLNVREATHKQIMDNVEITNIIKILGLKHKETFESRDDLRKLRYGKLMIMTDQDQDGSHIKGLIINFIHFFWPSLIRLNFLEEFITPIIKATKKNEELSFFSIPEFEEWKNNTENWHRYSIKYYKGLGTSTSKEAKEYFSNMDRHRIKFRYSGEECEKAIVMAFSKKMADARKEWLTNWMQECKRRNELGLAEDYLYTKDTKHVTYKDFIYKELVLFSNMDIERSIPSMVDGFKPGSRKVLFTCFKRNDKKQIKVAQLAGSVAEHSAYHHGEVSLMATIINLAQNFVGSNNINLLKPIGQFGTRLQGGKEAASPRYIFTMMSPLTRLIFHPHDDPLLKYLKDDNQRVEPEWYIPVIPMVLVNGAEGIGTGWMTKIPNHNPREIISNLRRMLKGEEPINMKPWYKNFKGVIEQLSVDRFIFNGEVGVLNDTQVEITELPVGTWTQTYKETVLEVLLNGLPEKCPPSIQDYKEYNTDTTVRFVVTMSAERLAAAEREGLHAFFKLQSTYTTTSMCAFDKDCCLKKYTTSLEILKEFYTLRLEYYVKRKARLEGQLQAESGKLSNQARFICEKCDNILTIENKKKKDMIAELQRKKYDSDPLKMWNLLQDKEAMLTDGVNLEEEGPKSQEEDEEVDETVATGGPDYDYLLSMAMWNLTKEKKDELLSKRDVKLEELRNLQRKTPVDIWIDDLDALEDKLNQVEQKEREDEELSTKAGVKSDSVAAKGGGGKGAGGKGTGRGGKKASLIVADFFPSATARRVAPVISDDLKKKVEKAIVAKENRLKKGPNKKKNGLDADEKDEFDLLVENSSKPLEERVGKSPASIEKKFKAKKKAADTSDSSPKKRSPKGSPRKPNKRSWSGSDDDGDHMASSGGSEFEANCRPQPTRQRSIRSAAAKATFKFSDDEMSSSGEDVLVENKAVVNGTEDEPVIDTKLDEESFNVVKEWVSDSDNDTAFAPKKQPAARKPRTPKKAKEAPAPQPEPQLSSDDSDDFFSKKPADKSNESSEDMFNSLIKSTKRPTEPISISSDDSPVKPPPKKAPPKKRAKKPAADDSDSSDKPAKTKKKKKKNESDSDEDMFAEHDKPAAAAAPVRSGGGRARKVVKYNFDIDDDSS